MRNMIWIMTENSKYVKPKCNVKRIYYKPGLKCEEYDLKS